MSRPAHPPMATGLPPVVLLHGWGGSAASTWAAGGLVECLQAQGRQVIALDLPGHGAQPAAHDPQAYADLAALVWAGLPPDTVFDIVGFSLGAKLSLALLLREPGRFRRAVIAGLGANVFAPERVGNAVAQALEQGVTDQTPPPIRALVAYGLSPGNDPLGIAAVLRRPPNPVLTPQRLQQITCAVLVVVGDQDAMAMPVAPLLATLTQAQSLVLPGVDHLGLPAQPAFVAAAVRFLS